MQLEAHPPLHVSTGEQNRFGSLGLKISTSLAHIRDRMVPHQDVPSLDRARNFLVINGHPDPRPERFCAALCDAYVEGTRMRNKDVRRLNAGSLTMALAAMQTATDDHLPASELVSALETIRWAGHLTIIFPLWLDQAPLPLQRLLGAALDYRANTLANRVAAAGSQQTARAIVTMEMPAFAHRSMFRGQDRSPALSLPGLSTNEPTFIGCVNTITDRQRKRWLGKVREFGMAAA